MPKPGFRQATCADVEANFETFEDVENAFPTVADLAAYEVPDTDAEDKD